MNRFTNRRLTDLEKLVAVTEGPIPRIEPWVTPEQAAEIYARELRRGRTFSARELEEARQGRTDEELAEMYAQSGRETWEEVRAAAAQAHGEAD